MRKRGRENRYYQVGKAIEDMFRPEIHAQWVCHVCGRGRDEVKLALYATTGDPQPPSEGRPAVIVACEDHAPDDVIPMPPLT
jgi:hypothetical protein